MCHSTTRTINKYVVIACCALGNKIYVEKQTIDIDRSLAKQLQKKIKDLKQQLSDGDDTVQDEIWEIEKQLDDYRKEKEKEKIEKEKEKSEKKTEKEKTAKPAKTAKTDKPTKTAKTAKPTKKT